MSLYVKYPDSSHVMRSSCFLNVLNSKVSNLKALQNGLKCFTSEQKKLHNNGISEFKRITLEKKWVYVINLLKTSDKMNNETNEPNDVQLGLEEKYQ